MPLRDRVLKLIDFSKNYSTIMSGPNDALGRDSGPDALNNFAQQQQHLHDKLDSLVIDRPNSLKYPNGSYYDQTCMNGNQFESTSKRSMLGSAADSLYYSSFDEDRYDAPNHPEDLWSFPEQDYISETHNRKFDPYLEMQPPEMATEPSVEIIEQPAPWAPKFRYMNERPTGRFPGAIPGVNSTSDSKTYPTIRINNIQGPARVVVSCVTAEEPHRVHPHGLVSREDCLDGICTIHLDESLIDLTTKSITKEFKGLGIECAKRRDIEKSLRKREQSRVDPYLLGYGHRDDPSSIDLNVIRLCFQVFIEGSERGVFNIPLQPCVTAPIRNVKIQSKLVICRLSHPSVEASGGSEIILLTEKIDPNDIQVRFYEEQGGQIVWESTIDITPANVHDKSALYFSTPMYRHGCVDENVMAWLQLVRKCDGQVSEPRKIMFHACRSDTQSNEHKKRKLQALLSTSQAPQPPQAVHTAQPHWAPQFAQGPQANRAQDYLYYSPNYPYYTNDPFLAGHSQANY